MTINRIILGLIIAVGCYGTAIAQTGNTAYGTNALISNTTGSDNSAFGENALQLNTTGNDNTASGFYALFGNATGNNNTANGSQALSSSTGSNNTASGYAALLVNSTGSYNTASGSSALKSNSTGNDNTASGYAALLNNQTGNYNTASGYFALLSNTTGSYNIGIGYQAGYFAFTGSNNIEIGNSGHTGDNNVIRIGKQGTQKFTSIAGISGATVTGGAQVLVNGKGRLGVASSSIRYKENVHSMGDASDKLLALRPVTFQYKEAEEDGSKPIQYGLVAEEVEKIMPDLVAYNDHGQAETVAYQTLVPLLLNELQREHARLEKMQAEIDELRKPH